MQERMTSALRGVAFTTPIKRALREPRLLTTPANPFPGWVINRSRPIHAIDHPRARHPADGDHLLPVEAGADLLERALRDRCSRSRDPSRSRRSQTRSRTSSEFRCRCTLRLGLLRRNLRSALVADRRVRHRVGTRRAYASLDARVAPRAEQETHEPIAGKKDCGPCQCAQRDAAPMSVERDLDHLRRRPLGGIAARAERALGEDSRGPPILGVQQVNTPRIRVGRFARALE
jgi:hypothetical protein